MQYLQVKYAKMGQNCMNMYIKKTQTLRKVRHFVLSE